MFSPLTLEWNAQTFGFHALQHRIYILGCDSLAATFRGRKGEGESLGSVRGTRCSAAPLTTLSKTLLSIPAFCPSDSPALE